MKKTGIPKLNVELGVLAFKLIGDRFEGLPKNRSYVIDFIHAAKHQLRIPIKYGLTDEFFASIEIEYDESDYAEMEMTHRIGWFWSDDQDFPRVPTAVPGALTGYAMGEKEPFQCSFGTWYQHFKPVERAITAFSQVDDVAPHVTGAMVFIKDGDPRFVDLDSS